MSATSRIGPWLKPEVAAVIALIADDQAKIHMQHGNSAWQRFILLAMVFVEKLTKNIDSDSRQESRHRFE